MSSDREPVFTFNPMVDRNTSIVGMRLRVHPGQDPSPRRAVDALNAVADVWPDERTPIHVALAGFTPTPEFAGWHAPQGAVIELPRVEDHETWLKSMNGHRPHVCGTIEAPTQADLFAVPASLVQLSPQIVAQRVQRKPWVAIESDDQAAFDACMKQGAKAAAGWSFLRQLPAVGANPLGNAASVIALIDMLNRDADVAEIEDVLRRDAVLAYRLVALVNAASFGLAVEIQSCRHAITILGMRALKRWLATLLATCGRSDNPPAWLQLSLQRAIFLERLGAHLGEAWNADDLFLCGAFSLLDRIFRIPFEDIFAQVTVTEAIRDALVDRAGPLTPLMDVVYSLERGEQARVRDKIDLLALAPRHVNHALVQAFSTAQQVKFS